MCHHVFLVRNIFRDSFLEFLEEIDYRIMGLRRRKFMATGYIIRMTLE